MLNNVLYLILAFVILGVIKMKEKEDSNSSHEDKMRALELAITQIDRQFGKGAIMRMGERPVVDVPVIPTGALSLDLALGVGGVPRGRIIEIYGQEGSGKTTICLSIIAQAQKSGGVAAFIDTENALNPAWAKTLGVDLENLLISQPDTGEQALEIVDVLIRSGGVDVVVVDSVAALAPRAEIEGEMGDAHVGLQARLMSQAMRKLSGVVNRTKTCLIFTNQIREKVGVMFGNPETTPGGRALKFYASVRMETRKGSSIKDGQTIVGDQMKVTIRKNKVAPPFRQAEFDIMFNEGISKEGNLIDLGVEYKIIQKSGAWLSYGEERLGQGRENAKQYLKEHPEIAQKIEEEIRKTVDQAPPAKIVDDEVDDDEVDYQAEFTLDSDNN
ncbi:TPA: recombinase RecA [Candidatus Poribacteria bacterium]|nr:recombinase RecA [Candidatus Poribacteria bacterium]